MFGLTDRVGRAALRATSIAAVCMLSLTAGAMAAKAETRTLKFYNLHTKEKVAIAYKKNGRYIPDGLKQINWFLRDWRRKEPTKMDTRLLDLIWEAYRQSGSRAYINVICGYRSAGTNNMLRSRSSGVAKESQHTQGRALDFFVPDVPLKKMREIGLKMQVGGVGYYPRSGSPFVHFDVGNARHWPRMSRKELVAVFPNGNTIHVPSDGKPLPGYAQALASYKARKGSSAVQVANAGSGGGGSSGGGGKTLLAMIFGGGADEEDDVADAEVAADDAAKMPAVKARSAKPPAAGQAAPATRQKPEAEIVVAAMAPSPKPNLLAAGVPLPIRDTFDTSAPAVQAAPPSALDAEAPAGTLVAALDIRRVPLPRAAPARTMAPTELVASLESPASSVAPNAPVPFAVAEMTQAPSLATVPAPSHPVPAKDVPDAVSTLVAAMDSDAPAVPSSRAGDAPIELAYAIPTPQNRPPFEAILNAKAAVAGGEAVPTTQDDIKRIVEASTAMRAGMASRPKTAVPAARPAVDAKSKVRPPAEPLLLASLDTPRLKSPAAAPALAKMPVPAGKTGRLASAKAARHVPAPSPARTQQAIASRIEMAALVADPATRAATAVKRKPNADLLVRDVPTSVFTAGFAPSPLSGTSNRFVGSAVTFLPVAKFE